MFPNKSPNQNRKILFALTKGQLDQNDQKMKRGFDRVAPAQNFIGSLQLGMTYSQRIGFDI